MNHHDEDDRENRHRQRRAGGGGGHNANPHNLIENNHPHIGNVDDDDDGDNDNPNNNHLNINNNNNNNVVPENRYIQDLDGWLQFNGLRAPAAQAEEKLDLQEERRRFEEFDSYQAKIHQSIFQHQDQERERHYQERQQRLEQWDCLCLDLIVADGEMIPNIQLRPLAESCDTVFCLAANREQYGFSDCDASIRLTFSLEHFPKSSVLDFVDVCFEKRTCHQLSSSESLVDCCQIAHYVQNNRVLQETVGILLESVDTANCLSMSQLADQLNLPLLFERSLSHMMNTMGELESNDAWDDLTPELRERIVTIKQAIQSSQQQKQGKLYFSSLDEYIAIFAERVQYYRERLAEAREQQQYLLEEQQQQRQHPHPFHRPPHASSSSSSLHTSPAWQYAQQKIDQQAKRVKTLEHALKEQKKLFRNKGFALKVVDCDNENDDADNSFRHENPVIR